MTITMTDVLSALPDTHVREALARAVETVQQRETRERSQEAARQEVIAAAMRGITDACRKQLPHVLALHVVHGFPDGWVYPPTADAIYFVEIALPDLNVPLRACFSYTNGTKGAIWRHIDYLLPDLSWRIPRGKPTWNWDRPAHAADSDTALANLVRLEAEYQELLSRSLPPVAMPGVAPRDAQR